MHTLYFFGTKSIVCCEVIYNLNPVMRFLLLTWRTEKHKNGSKFLLQQMWERYPKHVSLIVGNEFCERFSYYGMRCKYR